MRSAKLTQLIVFIDISLTSAATKNTELDDDGMSNEKLTTPLNANNSTIANNIYTATPMSNGSVNKHVTWRPETPPSPPPNVYTVSILQRSGILS